MENSMKIANKFSHFHSAPQLLCVCVYLCVMFIFYRFRPQCVRCNNYTTQSTQKEPRGSTSTNKKVARTNKNASKTHLFPLTVGISCNRCRKKKESRLLRFLHKFHNLQISHVFGQKPGVNELWPMVTKWKMLGFSLENGRRWISI